MVSRLFWLDSGGLGGIGMGLGLSGQPIVVNEIKMNNAMGIMASGGMSLVLVCLSQTQKYNLN